MVYALVAVPVATTFVALAAFGGCADVRRQLVTLKKNQRILSY
jgi:hypothetical protein